MTVTIMTSNNVHIREEAISGRVALTCLVGLLLGAYVRLLALEPSTTFLQSIGLFDLNQTTILKIGATTHLYYALSLLLGIFLIDWVNLPVFLSISALIGIVGNLTFGAHETTPGLIHATALVSISNGFTLLCLLKIFSQLVPKKHLPVMFGLLFASMAVSPALAANSFIPLLKHHHAWPMIDEIMSIIGLILYTSLLTLLHFNKELRQTTISFNDVINTYSKISLWICAAIGGLAALVITTFISIWLTPVATYYFQFDAAQSTWMANLSFWGLIAGIITSGIMASSLTNVRTFFAGCFFVATICFATIFYIPGSPLWLISSLCFLTGMSVGSVYLTYMLAREHIHVKQIGLGFGLIALAFQFGNLKAVSFLSQLNFVNQSVGDYAAHLDAAITLWQRDLALPLAALNLCALLILLMPKAKTVSVPHQTSTTLFNHYKLAWAGKYPLLSCLGFVYGLGMLVMGLAIFMGLSALSADYTMQIHVYEFAFSAEVNKLFRILLLPYFAFATICAWRCAVSEERALRYATRACLSLVAAAYFMTLL